MTISDMVCLSHHPPKPQFSLFIHVHECNKSNSALTFFFLQPQPLKDTTLEGMQQVWQPFIPIDEDEHSQSVLIICSDSSSEQWLYCQLYVSRYPYLCAVRPKSSKRRRRESLLRPCQRYESLEVLKKQMKPRQTF